MGVGEQVHCGSGSGSRRGKERRRDMLKVQQTSERGKRESIAAPADWLGAERLRGVQHLQPRSCSSFFGNSLYLPIPPL